MWRWLCWKRPTGQTELALLLSVLYSTVAGQRLGKWVITVLGHSANVMKLMREFNKEELSPHDLPPLVDVGCRSSSLSLPFSHTDKISPSSIITSLIPSCELYARLVQENHSVLSEFYTYSHSVTTSTGCTLHNLPPLHGHSRKFHQKSPSATCQQPSFPPPQSTVAVRSSKLFSRKAANKALTSCFSCRPWTLIAASQSW